MGLFSKKQKAPRAIELEEFGFEPVDVGVSSQKALEVSQQALGGDIQSVVAAANEFQVEQAISIRESLIPGFGALQSRLTQTAQSLATDPFELPEELKGVLAQQAAERGIRGGTTGSQFDDFNAIKNFGTAAIQFGFQKIGLSASLLQNIVAASPSINPLSPASFLITPGEVFRADIEQETKRATFDAQLKLAQQEIAQSAENARVAAENAAASGGEILGGIITGGISGFLTGGPAGAFAGAALGGISAATGTAGAGTPGLASKVGERFKDFSLGEFFGGGSSEFVNPEIITPF